MVLSCQNISKSFGEEPVLKQVSFHVEEYEKTAVVGINGAGKSTLLKIIMGELEPDEGTVTIAKGKSIGYLAQHQDMSGSGSIYEKVLEAKSGLIAMEQQIRSMEERMQGISADGMEAFLESYHRLMHEFDVKGGYTYASEVAGVLKGLGFPDAEFDKPCRELSGGQKTRVSLAKLLVSHPDIILLDEPTNHLDIASIGWLETFLQNYKGTVIVVAHDRYFLDRVVTKVVEISLHRSAVYEGNYSSYAERAAKVREDRLKAYYNQQREIRRQEEVIEKLKSFNREKSIRRAESREKQLAKVDVLEKPMEEDLSMRITLTPSVVSGKDVLTVCRLSKSFGEKVLFDEISFEIKRGERVALIGPNGTGKTTILKILNQVIDADAGFFQLGTNVKIGYYDQEQQELHMEKTLFDEISDDYPDMNRTRIRNVLASFLFTEDEVFKLIGDLSGGERGRLSLAKLMLSEVNFLILDEPTNHLDIASKEILEDALNHYEGTVLFVSHDRYFINRAATRILSLTGGQILNFIGNYDYYLEKREAAEAAAGVSGTAGKANAAAGMSGKVNAAAGASGKVNVAVGASGKANTAVGASGKANAAAETSGKVNAAAGASGKVNAAAGTSGKVNAAAGASGKVKATAGVPGTAGKANAAAGNHIDAASSESDEKKDWKAMKAEQARLRKRRNQINRLEDEISKLEKRLAEIDEEFARPEIATNSARLGELHSERTGLAAKLEELYTEWEELFSE